MELLEIENSRATHLVQLWRPAGQLYMPEAAAKVVQRYSFARFPAIEVLTAQPDFFSFGGGKFADSQIQEFRVYRDGFVVEARSNAKILDEFLDDILDWGQQEFGLEPVSTVPVERHHESSIIVKADTNLSKLLAPLEEIAGRLNKLLQKKKFRSRPFEPSGFVLAVDDTGEGSRRKETRFILDRRIGVSFAENVFFSQAPLPTNDHLALLEQVEVLARLSPK